MKLTREEVLELAVKAGFYFDVLPEHAPTQHTLPLHYSEECFHRFGVLLQTDSVNLDKPLAESAVAPGECGSVPDERTAFEAHIRMLSPKRLFMERWPDGSYKHIAIEEMWKGWQARAALGMQPPNTAGQPNEQKDVVEQEGK